MKNSHQRNTTFCVQARKCHGLNGPGWARINHSNAKSVRRSARSSARSGPGSVCLKRSLRTSQIITATTSVFWREENDARTSRRSNASPKRWASRFPICCGKRGIKVRWDAFPNWPGDAIQATMRQLSDQFLRPPELSECTDLRPRRRHSVSCPKILFFPFLPSPSRLPSSNGRTCFDRFPPRSRRTRLNGQQGFDLSEFRPHWGLFACHEGRVLKRPSAS